MDIFFKGAQRRQFSQRYVRMRRIEDKPRQVGGLSRAPAGDSRV